MFCYPQFRDSNAMKVKGSSVQSAVAMAVNYAYSLTVCVFSRPDHSYRSTQWMWSNLLFKIKIIGVYAL
jgi:hypothetical protein